ncbi:MAG: primosomal protein N' [Bacteroidaceae bacterium]|nr:primosomal protein N' [Bacteroidaceae bacterium]
MAQFVDVLLPLPLPTTYTYSVPTEHREQVATGCRVVVPLGKSKRYTALVMRAHDEKPQGYETRPFSELLDEAPILLPTQLKLWEWIAKYYLCTQGEIYKAAVPQGLKGEFKARTEQRIRVAKGYRNSRGIELALASLARAPRQKRLLNTYLQFIGGNIENATQEIARHKLIELAEVGPNICKELIEKGIFECYEVEIGRLAQVGEAPVELNELNPVQQKAFEEINEQFATKNTVLLHGVTSAGKTEIYIHLIKEALERGEQILYLLPEIALTKQIIERLRRVFGNRIGLYHSKFSDAERVEIWKKQLSEKPYDIILGVRSSLFLPFKKLGLVIVDEEHENSYKQQEPAPRYNAKNAAIVLASFFGAKTLLGTATPAIESYYNATTGKYGLVSLTQRYRSIKMPKIEVVDIKELGRKKQMEGQFSDPLIEAMSNALKEKKQIILFQNRRGYSPLLECRTCGWVPHCKHCDVSLTLHKAAGKLTCHYCGYTIPAPKMCPNCEESNFINLGYGTEKIEEELSNMFPHARIARMDLDTTRTRTAYEKIINDFQQGKNDVLIGTQMVSKGLDFDNVSVVGILNADILLNYPDFRAAERSFQLMAQVAGRAGRKNEQGTVYLQTKSPDATIIPQIKENDFLQFYNQQLGERMLFHYPPFYRLVYVYLKHRNIRFLDATAERFGSRMREIFGERVLGPDLPPVAKVQQLYIRKIVLKVETNTSQYKINEALSALKDEFLSQKQYNALTIYYDVDPL